MNVTEILGQARDTISVQRVFGAPIEKNGVLVIPVARVMGGGGGGDGELQPKPVDGDGAEGDASGGPAGTSSGLGYGIMAGPAGVYVVKGDQVTWRPAVSVERMTAIGGGIAILTLLILRSMLRIVVRR